MTTCATCQHWTPKSSGDMAKHLMCRCAKGPAWQYLPPHHACPRHTAVAPDVGSARAAWIDKHHARNKAEA